MAVDFKHDIEFYRKPFLPTWGSQAYFYADEQVCTTPDGLVLENGEEVKIGFFPTIDAPVTLEGRTDFGSHPGDSDVRDVGVSIS